MGWAVWTDWYEACLAGAPSERSLEQVLSTLSRAEWQREVNEVNGHIGKSIQSRSKPMGAVLDRNVTIHESDDALSTMKEIRRKDIPTFDYEVALSVAGPDRQHAQDLYEALLRRNISVFYDKAIESSMWGKDLGVTLFDVFNRKARYCVVFVSKEYAIRNWTNHEFRSALARAVGNKEGEYILPIRIDNAEIDGLSPSITYSWIDEGAERIADKLVEKIRASDKLN